MPAAALAHRGRAVPRGFRAMAACGVLWLAGCAGLPATPTADQRRAAEVNAELGISYLRQGDLVEAQRALERSLQFDSRLAVAQLGMGSLRDQQGLPELAIEHYRSALELQPGDPYAQTNLGDLLCRQGQFDEGRRLLARAAANVLYPARPVALLNAGRCELRAGNAETAEIRFRELLRLVPDSADALVALAGLSLDGGQPLQARAFLSRLDALGRMGPDSLLLCYRSEKLLGDAAAAMRCANRLRRDFGDSAEAATLRRMEQSNG
jgi:type IV pilus assembly protein PilF